MEKANVQKTKSNPEGYNRAIQLIQGQVQLFWLIFGAFLLSETVLLSAIASVLGNKDSGHLIFWSSVFGLVLSFLWFTTSKYNHAFYMLRMNEAKTFEPNGEDFFSHGQKLFDGELILDVKISKCIKMLRPKRSMMILIGMYSIAFILIGLFNCPWI